MPITTAFSPFFTTAAPRLGAWALAGACLLCSNAWAQTSTAPSKTPSKTPSKGEKQAEIWFSMLDANRDGYLTWNEVKHIQPLAKEFKAADVSGTGRVSRDDIRALSKKRLAERRARKAQAAQAAAAASAPAAKPAQP